MNGGWKAHWFLRFVHVRCQWSLLLVICDWLFVTSPSSLVIGGWSGAEYSSRNPRRFRGCVHKPREILEGAEDIGRFLWILLGRTEKWEELAGCSCVSGLRWRAGTSYGVPSYEQEGSSCIAIVYMSSHIGREPGAGNLGAGSVVLTAGGC